MLSLYLLDDCFHYRVYGVAISTGLALSYCPIYTLGKVISTDIRMSGLEARQSFVAVSRLAVPIAAVVEFQAGFCPSVQLIFPRRRRIRNNDESDGMLVVNLPNKSLEISSSDLHTQTSNIDRAVLGRPGQLHFQRDAYVDLHLKTTFNRYSRTRRGSSLSLLQSTNH